MQQREKTKRMSQAPRISNPGVFFAIAAPNDWMDGRTDGLCVGEEGRESTVLIQTTRPPDQTNKRTTHPDAAIAESRRGGLCALCSVLCAL
ncbi:hypothetical protein EYC84_003421 [Monilinia fructicola]|uniref:Uncharacterized protein n=1 Tax=Monilinia fructicola TaxID=38448 RepID=A0A5M9JUG1_MONFR|nr:hypothetical protein EYC84_003421 [Monilinia fructicola]